MMNDGPLNLGIPASVRRQRNGRLQACDPCRRNKQSCNHGRPCNRCMKKNQQSRCTYGELIVPRKNNNKRLSPIEEKHKASSVSDFAPDTQTLAPSPLGNDSILVNEDADPSSPLSNAPTPSKSATGYLGFTSFEAVYQETRDSLSEFHLPSREVCDLPPSNPCRSSQAAKLVLVARWPRIRDICLALVRQIPPREVGMKVAKPPAAYHSLIHSMILRMLPSLYDTWGDHLAATGTGDHGGKTDESQLEEMAKAICYNTGACVDEDVTDPREWLAQFTGPNLRWDSLGVMLMYWSGHNPDRTQARHRFELCIQLCRQFAGNSTFWILYLYHRRTLIESLISGDGSLGVWECHSQAMAVLTFHGSHMGRPTARSSVYKPTLQSELSRFIFWVMYCTDKVITSFTGRPPHLSRRYVSTPLPLDLTDDSLLASHEERLRAVETTLDEEGWNKQDGEMYSFTVARARCMLALIRDEVHEMALGNDAATIPIGDILNLRSRAVEAYGSVPRSAVYDPDEEYRPDTPGHSSVIFAKLLLRVEYLQSLFILDRLLLKRRRPGDGDLLGVSFELVILILSLWTGIEKFQTEKKNYEWMIMGYAAPAGGILCMELLKPSFYGTTHPSHSHISRSSITQNLSLLVGFLSWVSPSAPNADLCQKTRRTIQQVLDQVLNASWDAGLPATSVEAMNWDFLSPFEVGGYDLMDTFTWLRSEPAITL
ncbi:hypothetical protein BX600DRAFT_555901 [Xylariales sp. PMI_506]|nr:hypothetical protein BX600DRAFT_555901 [Xylariales sp. PMI_506]